MSQNFAPEERPGVWLHGGDLVARQLKQEGVDYLFTLTGGHISGIFDGARFQQIKLIDFRHEQAAVHCADAYARLTQRPAVAALTAGPGVTNGLTGIANAYYANSPVVVLGGRNPFALGSFGNLQDAPHLELTRPITKYADAIYDPFMSSQVIRHAFAAALTPRYGPAYVDVPMDIQLTRMATEEAPAVRAKPESLRAYPDPSLVKKAATMLGKAKRAVIIAGSGAYWDNASASLSQLATLARVPVLLNGMARGLLGKHFPFQVTGGRQKLLLEADVILLLGADLDFRFGYGQANVINPETRIIQVDADATAIGRHRDVALPIVSNIHNFLTELLSYDSVFASANGKQGRMEDLQAKEKKGRASWSEPGGLPGKPVHPRRFVHDIVSYLDDDAIVIGDGGDIVASFAELYRPGKPGHWMDPGPFGCIGIGTPFAMGARLAHPGKPVVVVSGDGAFGFNAFEIDSAVRQNLPFVMIIGNDGAWGEMRTFHEDIFGPDDPSAQYLSQETAYETVVNGLGGFGQRVEDADEIIPALDRAFASGVPSVINVILDPAYRRNAQTISGKHIAMAYSNGDADAYKRTQDLKMPNA